MGAIKSKNTARDFSATHRGLRSNSIQIQNPEAIQNDLQEGVLKDKSQDNQIVPELQIKTTTWQKDSHGLFDYEGKETERKQIKGKGTFSIMRDNTNVEIKQNYGGGAEEDNRMEESKEEESLLTQIAKIVEKNGEYWIYHKSTLEETEEDIENNPENKLWYVVKHCRVVETTHVMHLKSMFDTQNTKAALPLGYRLMPNDVIKLGRVRFKVREIISPAYTKRLVGRSVNHSKLEGHSGLIQDGEQMSELKNNFQNAGGIQYSPDFRIDKSISSLRPHYQEDKPRNDIMIIRSASQGSQKSNQQVCRICLSEDDDPISNPLFSPCKCSGTMRYIHLMCLQDWLNSRMITKETVSTKTFYWKDLNCELCKTAFPNYVKKPSDINNSKEISLHVVNYEKPIYGEQATPAYLVLESITNAQGKVIHVVDMSKCEQAKIGRGNDVDVRITDISVSRLHAFIKKTSQGYFYVQDNRSKFGTLTLIRHPIMLHQTQANIIQAGRTMLEIHMRMPVIIQWTNCFCNGGVKQKKRLNSGVHGNKHGLTTLNGFDFFPIDFLNYKLKGYKKEVEENLQILENNISQQFPQQRPLSQLGCSPHLNQVHPLPFPSPPQVSNELIQNLNLIREDSLDINYSIGPNIIEQQILQGGINMGEGGSSLLQPSYLSVNQALQQMKLGQHSIADANILRHGESQNEEERNVINLIQAELENSLSRLMEDHKSLFDEDNPELDRQVLNFTPIERAQTPYGGHIQIIEELKEADDSVSNEQCQNNVSRQMLSITPIKAQNFIVTQSVAHLQQLSSKVNLKTPNDEMYDEVRDMPFQIYKENNNQGLETEGEFKAQYVQMSEAAEKPTQNSGQKKTGPTFGHFLIENQSIPTGRFLKQDYNNQLVKDSPTNQLEIGFANIFPTTSQNEITQRDNNQQIQFQTPYHNPLATTFVHEDFKTIEFRNDQSLINSPFIIHGKPLNPSNKVTNELALAAKNLQNNQIKNQQAFVNPKQSRLSMPSKLAPIENNLTLNAGNKLFSPIDSNNARKSDHFASPLFKDLHTFNKQRESIGSPEDTITKINPAAIVLAQSNDKLFIQSASQDLVVNQVTDSHNNPGGPRQLQQLHPSATLYNAHQPSSFGNLTSTHGYNSKGGLGEHTKNKGSLQRMQAIASSYGVEMPPKAMHNSAKKGGK